MSSDDLVKKYDSLKTQGNAKFKCQEYDAAIQLFTAAIKLVPNNPVAYSNRAQCYINTKRYYEAIEDCDKVIELDNASVKAYYRRAQASKNLCRFRDAIKDLERVKNMEPSFTDASLEIQNLLKVLDDDVRQEIKPYHKPARFCTDTPLQEFQLQQQYYGSKQYKL